MILVGETNGSTAFVSWRINQRSDLTVGRLENVLDNIGAIAGPFPQGPIDEPYIVETEQELSRLVKPSRQTPNTNTGWVLHRSSLTVASSRLFVQEEHFNNANAGSAGVASDTSLSSRITTITTELPIRCVGIVLLKPRQWANNLKVSIDDLADQTLTLGSADLALTLVFGLSVGQGVTVGLSTNIASVGFGTSGFDAFSGHLKGIITGINTDVSGAEKHTVDVKIVSRVSVAGSGSTETSVYYQKGSAQNAFVANSTVFFRENGGGLVNATGVAATAVVDWYDQQKLKLDNGTVFWKSLASRPVSNAYVLIEVVRTTVFTLLLLMMTVQSLASRQSSLKFTLHCLRQVTL